MTFSASRLATLTATAVAALAVVPAADGASRLVIKGAGFGHGVGMSQYGAFGFAKEGRKYDAILGHYYSGTKLSTLDAEPVTRVLLQSGISSRFSGAVGVAGGRKLNPNSTYRVRRTSKGMALVSSSGRTMSTYTPPMRVLAPSGGAVRLLGSAANGVSSGRYRGALEFRPGAAGGVVAINAVSLEDYVRGVVSAESPSSWPIEALKAQAVAARTYAITTNKPGDGFEHYADIRSQVYRGVAAEFPSTDRAVAETTRQIVTADGKPVVTYFFSTSGGRTEAVEHSFLGAEPQSHLKSVEDPFDKTSPKHRWTRRLTMSTAKARLGGLVKGEFRRIKVIKRGDSPRVVRAQVIGSRGTTTTTGPELRRRLRLDDTWASFTVISSNGKKAPKDAPAPTPPAAPAPEVGGDPGSGGVAPTARAAGLFGGAQRAHSYGRISGSIQPAEPGSWLRVERRAKGRWVLVAEAVVGKRGRYSASVPRAGSYRVVHAGMAGPTVRLK
jgi:stage II sporulation protein D